MAPSRSQNTAQSKAQTRAQDKIAAVHSATRERSKRNAPAPVDNRNVYRELISEATPSESDGDRPLKRPRLGRSRQVQQANATADVTCTSQQTSIQTLGIVRSAAQAQVSDDETSRPVQTVIDSDESDEDDMDWEQVGLDHVEPQPPASRKDDEFGDVSLEISTKKGQKKAIAKRKPATTAEKLLRLEVHEAHVLFLLFHVHVRNAWCNMAEVQVRNLSSIFPSQMLTRTRTTSKPYLHPKLSLC